MFRAFSCVGGGEPLEELRELAQLTGKGEEQRFRVMELAPVSQLGKRPHLIAKID